MSNNSNTNPATPAIFQFTPSFQVRVIAINNEPWFCLRDVCKILDLNIRSSQAFGLDERGVQKHCTPTESGNQDITFVSEPNLYRVIFRSNKAEAKQFQDWIFNDVLPSIRKHGYYAKPELTPEPPPVEYITSQQECELKRVVYYLSSGVHFDGGWRHGIYSRLRTATQSKAPNRYEVKHLPIIANELYQMMAVIKAMKQITRDFEAKVLKSIIKDGKDLIDLEPLIKEVEAQRQELLKDLSSGFIAKYQSNLEQYELKQLNALMS